MIACFWERDISPLKTFICTFREEFTNNRLEFSIKFDGNSIVSRGLVILKNTVAHRGHRFHKEKTLQIKKFLANINSTSKKSSPAHCEQKRNCKNKQMNFTLQTTLRHAANKRITRFKQNSRTLQTKLQHAANKTPARCKQKNYTLQTKLQHAANETPAHCKPNSSTLQTKGLHAAN